MRWEKLSLNALTIILIIVIILTIIIFLIVILEAKIEEDEPPGTQDEPPGIPSIVTSNHVWPACASCEHVPRVHVAHEQSQQPGAIHLHRSPRPVASNRTKCT